MCINFDSENRKSEFGIDFDSIDSQRESDSECEQSLERESLIDDRRASSSLSDLPYKSSRFTLLSLSLL